MTACIGNLILFIRPLIQITHLRRRSKQDERAGMQDVPSNESSVSPETKVNKIRPKSQRLSTNDARFVFIVKKVTKLTITGVVSTILVAVIVYLVGMNTVWVVLDCICNTWVILLMFGWNNKYYQIWCECQCNTLSQL